MSMNKKSLTEFLKGLGIIILIVGGIWLLSLAGNSNGSQTATTSSDKDDAISKAQNDIDDKYGDLLSAGKQLTGEIDTECVWLSDNISNEVGDYCNDNANSNYADINGDNWTSGDISYDDTQPLNDIIDTIVSGANEQYDNMLSKIQDTEGAMETECGWLGDNVSSTVADDCDGSYNHISNDYSTDPFNASDYYGDSTQ